jgi:prepilin-type N-terminal cleavage/methylation domain-containing protein
MKQKGFTLIEILVVIGLIAILMSLAVLSYSTTQKNARDARRKGDMKTIQNAFEQYYSDNAGKYPTSELALASYLPSGYPIDPKDPTTTYTRTIFTATAYCVCAELDMPSGNASDTSCTFAAGAQPFYCVKNLQR